MEFEIKAKDGALPCEVTIDEDNGRYMLRNADTTGEFFETPTELRDWIQANWNPNRFEDPNQFELLISELNSYT
ncbi:hypothetical protein [Evansella tamaricis]|uniref:Threonine dehydratase n=1 Tax=Evansella tamaricis TaxID=2069301 RepID=A0ABS6JKI4_9BACI|nr:hypothetical protein [Evansella tamaricis]MBU9714199.1 hypothetical protein [Evansella tamaricis]